MMERRARQHQPVEEGDANADVGPSRQLVQESAFCRAMQDDAVTLPRVAHGDHHRAILHDKPHVGQDPLVENLVNLCFVVRSAARQPMDRGTLRRFELRRILATHAF